MKTLWILSELHRPADKKVLDKLTQMSRITRNSYRPRASDRTMVGFEVPVSLAALSDSIAAAITKRSYENG